MEIFLFLRTNKTLDFALLTQAILRARAELPQSSSGRWSALAMPSSKHRAHSVFFDSYLLQFIGGRVPHYCFSDIFFHFQNLKNAEPPYVARILAYFAARSAVKPQSHAIQSHGFRVFLSQLLFNIGDFLPVSPNNWQCCLDEFFAPGAGPSPNESWMTPKRLNLHIKKPGQSHSRVSRMQSGKYKPPGHGGIDGYFGRFRVPNFSHQHHIGILPQKRAQTGGKK